MDLNPKIVYAMWDGYLDKEKYPHAYNPEWAAFKERHKGRWKSLHTAGHATRELIRDVISAVEPREQILPIHTENAKAFLELDLPAELKAKIRI